MKVKKYNDLFSRLIAHSFSALIVALLIVFSVLCPFRPLFVIMIAMISLKALCEYYGLVKKKGIICAPFLACVFGFFFLFATLLQFHPEIVLGAAFVSLFIYYAMNKEPILGMATTIFGLIYIMIPFACMVRIATQFHGPSNGFWLAYLILVTKSADMGGYFIGRILGRHKLAKKLSPNKTIEGALGGILFAVLVSLIFVYIDQRYLHLISNFSYLLSALLGFVLSIFAMIGDLAESLLKRDAKVKDSGNISGIGGILDVVDALLFTTPVLYLFLKFHYPTFP